VTTDLTVNADAATFIEAVNIDAETSLSNSFIVDTCISMTEAIALYQTINNR